MLGCKIPLMVGIQLCLLVNLMACLDLESSKERSCIPPPPTVQVDSNYWNAITTYYYPLMSRHDLYLCAPDIAHKTASEITEGELYYDGQLYFEFDAYNGSFIGKGFHGRTFEYAMKELSPGVFDFRPAGPPPPNSYAGTLYAVMTDNRTFTLYTFCSDQNQATWCILSSIPRLTKETEQLIYKRVKELGFREEYFTQLRYGTVF